MKKTQNKPNMQKFLGIMIIITLGLMLLFMLFFYEYHILPKQARVLDKKFEEDFIQVNEGYLNLIETFNCSLSLEQKDILFKLSKLLEAMKDDTK